MKLLIAPIGLLTNNIFTDNALILEARWLLANRYQWEGRCIEANKAFNNSGRFSIDELLEIWDLYNKDMENRSRRDYYIMSRLDLDNWGLETTD